MEAHANTVQFAGDYRLDGIILHNHQNEGIDIDDEGDLAMAQCALALNV